MTFGGTAHTLSTSSVKWPDAWRGVPLWALFERIKDVGHPDEEMLSVYRDHGVVKKDSRDDNANKTAENRNIYQLVDSGWFIVNRMKAWQGSVGISDCRGIVSGHYICYRPRHNESTRFLNWLLRSAAYTAEYACLSRGVRPSQMEIDNDGLRVLPVRLPSLEKQKRIASYLDVETARIDTLIAKKRLLIDLLGERRLSTTAEAVSGRFGGRRSFVNASLPWLDMRPEQWDEVPLRLVTRQGSGHTPSRDHPEWWIDCTIPWITTGEVQHLRSDRIEYLHDSLTREKISELGLANSAAELHPAETVVLCRTAASAGYSGITKTPMATSQDFATWTCGPLLRPRFLLLCLRAMRRDLLDRLAMGSTHKTIYMPDIRSVRIPLPPVAEQDEIIDIAWQRLTRIDQAMDALERQIALLQEHRQALIAAAVTGELDVAGRGG